MTISVATFGCFLLSRQIVNPFKASVRNVGSLMKAMPDNFADGVARVSGGLRNIPNNMLDGVGRILHVKVNTFIMALKVIPLDQLQRIICSVIQEPWLLEHIQWVFAPSSGFTGHTGSLCHWCEPQTKPLV